MSCLNTRPLGPIYTVNLPNDLIGHSRGGMLAQAIAPWGYSKKACYEIGKVIKIGNVLSQQAINSYREFDSDFANYTYEITGEYNVLMRESSLLASDHQKQIPSGHLGLLYSSQAHKQIMDWLN